MLSTRGGDHQTEDEKYEPLKKFEKSRQIVLARSDSGINLDFGSIPRVCQSSEYWYILVYRTLWTLFDCFPL